MAPFLFFYYHSHAELAKTQRNDNQQTLLAELGRSRRIEKVQVISMPLLVSAGDILETTREFYNRFIYSKSIEDGI